MGLEFFSRLSVLHETRWEVSFVKSKGAVFLLQLETFCKDKINIIPISPTQRTATKGFDCNARGDAFRIFTNCFASIDYVDSVVDTLLQSFLA